MAKIDFKHTPYGDLALISMKGCEDIASKVDYYLKNWREADENDTFNGKYYLNLGGSGAYPYTVILDENGVIQEIFVKALHYEDLKEAVENIKN